MKTKTKRRKNCRKNAYVHQHILTVIDVTMSNKLHAIYYSAIWNSSQFTTTNTQTLAHMTQTVATTVEHTIRRKL